MEGATTGSQLGGRRLGSSLSLLVMFSFSEVFCHTSGGKRLGGVRALLDVSTGRAGEDTLVVVEVVNLCVTRNAGIPGGDLTGAELKSRTHDGALCSSLGEL